MAGKFLVPRGRRWTQPLLLIMSLLGVQQAFAQADVMKKIFTTLSGVGVQGPPPTGWGDGDPCGWVGVTCGADGKSVEQLDLTAWKFNGPWFGSITDELPTLKNLNAANVGFTGMAPPSLNNALVTVDLSGNSFGGQIPVANSLNLTTLNLARNMFTQTAYVGNAANLTSLDLSSNTGLTNFNIDNLGLGNLKSLQTLDISNGGFTGQLPSNWASLTGLQTLKLQNNMFDGPLPPELGLLSEKSLTALDISGNKFTGDVPPGYEKLGAGFKYDGNPGLLVVPGVPTPAPEGSRTPAPAPADLPSAPTPSAAVPTADTPTGLPPATQPPPPAVPTSPPPPGALAPPPGVCNPCSTGVVYNATCACVAPINATILLPQANYGSFSSDESQRTGLKSNLVALLGVGDSQVLVYPSRGNNNAVKADVLLLPLAPATSWTPSEQMRIQTLLQRKDINFGGQLGPVTVSNIALPATTPIATPTTPVASPPAPPSSGKKKTSIGPLVGAAVGALAVVAIIAAILVCCCLRRQKRDKERQPMASGFDSDQHKDIGDYEPPPVKSTFKPRQASFGDTPVVDATVAMGSAKLFDLRDLQTATNFFARENIIGEGSFGRVYKAEMPDGKVLAVKKLELPNTAQKTAEFQGVVRTVSSLSHENLVRLDGYVADPGAYLLAYDYVGNGSLFDHLHTAESGQLLIWPQRVRIALGTARALQYLHESNDPPVIHRNIKSANILVDENMMPYVADTGLTVLGQGPNAQASTQMLGAIGYAAPEYAMSGQHTAKSDVYSFGVVCLELLTGRRPLDSSRPRMEQSLVRWAVPQLQDVDALARMADPKLQGHYPIKSLARFADIIALCVQPEPEFRPPMSDVVQALVRLMQRSSQKVKNSGELYSGDLTGRDSFV